MATQLTFWVMLILKDMPRTLEVIAQDGLLVILTPQPMSNLTTIAQALNQHVNIAGEPVLASWMASEMVEPRQRILDQAGIPTFAYPDTAAQTFTAMWRSYYSLQALDETPILPTDGEFADASCDWVKAIMSAVRAEGRTILTELESKQILIAYDIPSVETYLAMSKDDAATAATSIGFPVVLELYSKTVTHKTDVGEVHLNITNR